MKISQPREATQHGAGLLLSLETWDTSKSFDAADASALTTIVPKLPVASFGDILSGEYFIAQGADFVGLFMESIELCAQCKLLLLCARLLQFAKAAMPTFMEVLLSKISCDCTNTYTYNRGSSYRSQTRV